MKSFQTQVLILTLALSILPGITTQLQTAMLASSIQPTAMKFSDSTGQSITLGKLGNLLSFRVKGAEQNAPGTRQTPEGYEIVYRENTQERRIYLGDIAHPELVPISFTSNRKNGEVIKAGDLLRVTAVVETRDGRFKLTHRFEWQAGTTFLWVKRQAENIATSRVDLIVMRSHVAAAGPTPCGPPDRTA